MRKPQVRDGFFNLKIGISAYRDDRNRSRDEEHITSIFRHSRAFSEIEAWTIVKVVIKTASVE